MSNIKQKFEALYQNFVERKAGFQDKLRSWQERGYDKAYQQGSSLIREIEECAQTIKQELALNQETDSETLQQNFKRIKKAFKQIKEFVKPLWRQWLEAIVTALVLATILRHTIFSPYHVPTGSAEPTILVGDRIWGNKMAYLFSDIKRGDYIICDNPEHSYDGTNIIQYLWQRYVGFPIPLLGLGAGPISITKRVVAMPGDTIEGKLVDGKTVIYLNGEKLDEPYVNKLPLIAVRRTAGFIPLDHVGPLSIPSFLQKQTKECFYVYDPSKSYDDQPYYYMSEKDIVYGSDGKPRMRLPYTPNMDYRGFGGLYTVDVFGPRTLPKDMYWCMGDSRKNSGDSRGFGPIPRHLIRGRVSFILFSLDSEEAFWLFDLIKHPITFWTKHMRWGRFFKAIN